jgi:hypothetical protein
MKTFTDNAGRTWTIAINVATVRRVRDLLGVDLLEIVEGKLIDRLIRDPILLCDVVYAVCKPEADAQNVTAEQFGQAMAGDAIDHATRALLGNLADFSPSPRDRANLQRVLAATWQAIETAQDLVQKRLDGGELERVVAQALASVGGSSPSAPESSDSTPVP